MRLFKVNENKEKDGKPFEVALKKGFAKEGQTFPLDQLLCADDQLENLLDEKPCRIKEVVVKKADPKKKKKNNGGN